MTSRRAIAFVAALACSGFQAAAWAQGPAADPVSPIDSGLAQQVRQFALDGSRSDAAGMPRIDVSVGQLDPRLRLAPCQHVEPYLPEGTRLWGKSRVGLRCTQGAVRWNVFLPIVVKVYGTALVATQDIAPGTVLTESDVTPAEVDLAEDNAVIVTKTELALGRTLTRALRPGEPVRAAYLKSRQYFTAGEVVTVVAQGEGFSVAAEGQALGNGVEGQSVRVRTDGGRVISGMPVADHRVEVPL